MVPTSTTGAAGVMATSCVFGAKPRKVKRAVYVPGRSPCTRNAPFGPAMAPVTSADVALFRIVTEARASSGRRSSPSPLRVRLVADRPGHQGRLGRLGQDLGR